MDVLQSIEQKLEKFGIQWDKQDIESALAEVDQAIKNYCHIDCVPSELLFVRSNLVVDYVRYMESHKPLEEGESDLSNTQRVGPLTYVITGGVTYGFGNDKINSNATCNSHVGCLDSLLNNYIVQLNAFRRVVW